LTILNVKRTELSFRKLSKDQVYEVQIPEAWDGHTLGELLEPLKQCYPVALSRAGHSLLPEADMRLQAGDMLDVSSTFEGIGTLTERLSKGVEA
jgi:Trk K+ transport system NAD-binding subunit